MRPPVSLCLVLALSLAGCSGVRTVAGGLGDAMTAPLEDVGMKRERIPTVLLQAQANPYDMRNLDRCSTIGAEVARLDEALGPDLDEPPAPDGRTLGDQAVDAAAEAALDAGALLVNDVSGFTFDPDLAPLCAARKAPVCVMHAQGDPATMQDDPRYDDVLLDVYDYLEAQVMMLTGLGLARDQILVDPGIGFGKTLSHNLSLLARISLFHSLGCPVLLGASRKGFIRVIGEAPEVERRIGGSVSVALSGVAQGVQLVRVHDVDDTRQALQLWQASTSGEYFGT